MNNIDFDKEHSMTPIEINYRYKKDKILFRSNNKNYSSSAMYFNDEMLKLGNNSYTDNNKYERIRGGIMDDNKMLEMYINKVDKDQSELKQDIRESEKRMENHMIQSEKRIEDRMNRIESLLVSQNDKIDGLKDEVTKQLSEDKKYRHTNNIAIALGVVATVLAMVGIYYATVSMITDIIGVSIK